MLSTNYTEFPSVRGLLEEGVAQVGPISISREFNDYVSQQYVWAGDGISWRGIDRVIQIDTGQVDEDGLKRYLDRTTLSQHANVAVMYSASQACIVLKYTDAIKYFDSLIMPTQHCFFLGLSSRRQEHIEAVPDFVEFRHIRGLRLYGIEREPSIPS